MLCTFITFIVICIAQVVQGAADAPITIWTWPLDGTPQQLAEVSVNTSTSTAAVKSYTPPASLSGVNVPVRVGFYYPTASNWHGVITSSASFDSSSQPKLVLHTDGADEVYHLGFEAESRPTGPSSTNWNAGSTLLVEIKKTKLGPTPHLNKPIVLSPDGKLPEKEQEKTFLQKCVSY